MKNSFKYKYIETLLCLLTDDGRKGLDGDITAYIVKGLMKLSKSRENPDTLPVDIMDTYYRLYG